MLSRYDFVHPEDAAALEQLEAVPGCKLFVRKFLSVGAERLQYGMNMASSIRLSNTQLPKIYNHLPPICEKLGITEPELYLTMNPVPNAWTFGDTRIAITLTSGLVEAMTPEELDAVIAHECGHIILHHTLYLSIAWFLASGVGLVDALGALSEPIKLALYHWQRKAELSADRVSCLITSPETTARTIARLAGGPASITHQLNMEEWAQQAERYEKIRTDDNWNKTLQTLATAWLTHPFPAVRVREMLKWSDSDQYKRLSSRTTSTHTCPNCGAEITCDWKYCRFCGALLDNRNC